jgi:hypothetical protein
MAQSKENTATVRFECDAVGIYVRKSLYIAGNHELLGNWTPNKVRLFDDGSHGDQKAGDGIWSLELQFPIGAELEYKFTNSGAEGNWQPGEEFGAVNRKIRVEKRDGETLVVRSRFGVL